MTSDSFQSSGQLLVVIQSLNSSVSEVAIAGAESFKMFRRKYLQSAKKIEQYGIRGIPLQLFTSYLTNRQQYTALGNTVSSR